MEWTDVIALDAGLSHVACRTGLVIGSHFNRHRGNAYLRQDTIARVMGVSERTVWSAITELETRGYLIVQRREFAPRKSDGRRVAGGRGVANVYLPAFERSQLSATNSGKMLAARCDLVWSERSQKPASKVATGCDPTLSSPTEKNPTLQDHALGQAGERLAEYIGRQKFKIWFDGVTFEVALEKTLILKVPKAFRAKWIRDNFRKEILASWRPDNPGLAEVEIEAAT